MQLYPEDSDVTIADLNKPKSKEVEEEDSSFLNGHASNTITIPSKSKKKDQGAESNNNSRIPRQVNTNNYQQPQIGYQPLPPPPMPQQPQPYSYGYPNLYPPPAPPVVNIHHHHPSPNYQYQQPQQQQQQQQSFGGGGFSPDYSNAPDGVDYEIEAGDDDGLTDPEEEEAMEEAMADILKGPLRRWKTHNFHGATEGPFRAIDVVRSVPSLLSCSSAQFLVPSSSLFPPS